jgi:hypothetical protein
MKAAALLISALAVLAQSGGGDGAKDAPKPEAAKPAPVIAIELQAEYFRTDGVLAHLKADLDKAQAEYEEAVKAVVKACGEGSAPTLTQDKKHLFCVAQSPAQAAAPKK